MKRDDFTADEFSGLADDLRQIVPAELAEPLEKLFMKLSEIRTVRASFGRTTLNVIVAVEDLEGIGGEIEKVCAQLWRQA